ncbi:MAG: type I restriction-modification system subunit M [Actinobacteria bacterium]|nr:type I restriction-modification system subunit M [Actinomycetota bacterium]
MNNKNKREISTPQSLNAYVKAICDIMRRSNCAGALQYVPELTWMLFLRILDEKEEREAEQAKAVGANFRPSLEYPYRWRDWAATPGNGLLASEFGLKRRELQNNTLGAFMSFVNGELISHLRDIKNKPGATPRQKVISEVFSYVERTRIDTERNLLDVLDKIHELELEHVDETHMFTLSQVYEGLLQQMGEKNNDGGQFFTPREVIRVMVKVMKPEVGETVYDPCCGTGGFLAQSYQHMYEKVKTGEDVETLKTSTFYGREKENLVYPIALANLVLHGIDEPHIWHGNTLTGLEVYGGLFTSAPPLFDVVLTNPPFGGKEGKEAQTHFAYKTRATEVLFLQHVIDSLKQGGRCGIVMAEGVLFRTNENAFIQTKRKLLNECNLWCIVSLPPKAFVNAGAASKTNLLFFIKGEPTKEIWYYDLSDLNITKKQPLTVGHFDEFFKLLPEKAASERSWSVSIEEIQAKNYDLKAVNPNRKIVQDNRTPEELIAIIEDGAKEVLNILEELKEKGI